MVQRFKIILEYDGRPFLGWQTQACGSGVQDAVEDALQRLFKQTVKTFCAGRTDTGVHAAHQVIHCDIETDMTGNKLREALNYYLKPHPIAVIQADHVGEDFHARFGATERRYRYKILNRRGVPTYRMGLVWHVLRDLNIPLMEQACKDFLGTHDYTTFRSVDCQSPSPIRTIDRAFMEQVGDELHFCVHAKSFLHHQIRSMVGSLVKVGTEQFPSDFIKTALAAQDRTACGPVAPPFGLYFEKVIY